MKLSMKFLVTSFLLSLIFMSCKNNDEPVWTLNNIYLNKDLNKKFTSNELDTITTLKISGTIDARDFQFMRDSMPHLTFLDISHVSISAYTGTKGTLMADSDYPANTIPPHAFYNPIKYVGKTTLKSFVFPTSITSIGESAFGACFGLKDNLVIPNSVTSIGDNAFNSCTGLTGSLIIPNSVISIGNYAFYECSGFTGTLTIPNSVTTIGTGAFSICINLSGSITIPNSVTSFGDGAFEECYKLTDYIVQTDNPNYSVTDGILFNKNKTILIAYPNSKQGNYSIPNSVTSIGNYAFCVCKGLTGNLIIPNSVTSIGDEAFSNCVGLTGNLVIPNSVTKIGIAAFVGCTEFSGSLTIGNSVTSIGLAAFSYCTGFTGSLIIPNSVTSIGSGSFSNCSKITSLTIPSSVTSIGSYAFNGCMGLTSIYANSKNPIDLSSSMNVFDQGIIQMCTLYVPMGTMAAYKAANQWKIFNYIIEI